MSPRSGLTAFLLLTAAFGAGCLQYNEPCALPVSSPDAVLGYIDTDIKLTPDSLRSRDNALGDAIGTAYVHAGATGDLSAQVVGLEASDAIASAGVCGERELLPVGPLTRSSLRQAFPLQDKLAIIRPVRLIQLIGILEHGVANLRTADSASSSGTPRPATLVQVAGMSYVVDCSQIAEVSTVIGASATIVQQGQRITEITIGQAPGLSHSRAEAEGNQDASVIIVTSASLAANRGGYLDAAQAYRSVPTLTPEPTETLAFEALATALVSQKSSPDNALRLVDQTSRITFRNCE